MAAESSESSQVSNTINEDLTEETTSANIKIEEDELNVYIDDQEEEETLLITQEPAPNKETKNVVDISLVTPPIDTPTSSSELSLPSNRIKRYVNNGGNFITGFDITSAEFADKKSSRESRFGHMSPSVKDTKVNKRLERFGGQHQLLSNGEKARTINKLPDIPEGGDPREEGVVVYGTDDMSTKDILKYFMEYGPSHLEWINDSSCVVVWEDPTSAQRGFLGKGVWPVIEEGGDQESTPIWRQGYGNLLLRKATTLDVKEHHSATKSRYYQKYGNPNTLLDNKPKRQKRSIDLRQRLDRKRLTSEEEKEQDEEMETMTTTNTEAIDQPQVPSVIPVSDFVTSPAKKQIRLVKDKDGEEKMEIELGGGAGGMRSDYMSTSTTSKSKNDLRNRIGSRTKREQLKSRLGAFPIM